MKKNGARAALVTLAMIAGTCAQTAYAADCVVANLDGAKIAGFYQSGGQTLARLYTLSQSAKDDDVSYSLQAQGPLASFSDASYMMADLIKLRSSLVAEKDRALLDADIRANLELAGPAFYSAADFLGALGPKIQNAQIKNSILAAHQLVLDGITTFGACLPAAPKH